MKSLNEKREKDQELEIQREVSISCQDRLLPGVEKKNEKEDKENDIILVPDQPLVTEYYQEPIIGRE